MGCAVGGCHFIAADNGRYLCFVLYTEGVEWVRGAKCVSMVCWSVHYVCYVLLLLNVSDMGCLVCIRL